MDINQLGYRYDAYGYMLTYKGKNLGGCGVSKRSRLNRSNLSYYKYRAERDIEDIKNNRGCFRYLEVIERIDKEGE